MPKILIPNIEEAFFHNSPNNKLPEGLLAKLSVLYARFLLCAESGDYIVVPDSIDNDFIDYLGELRGGGYIKTKIINAGFRLENGQLAETAANTPEIIETLKRLNSGNDTHQKAADNSNIESKTNSAPEHNLKNTGNSELSSNLVLEPFIASENIVKISEKTAIPVARLKNSVITKGTVNNFNNKIFIKNAAVKLGIAVIKGITTSGIDNIKNAAVNIARETNSGVMIKKPDFASGLGNLGGSLEYVLSNLDSFYDGGEVIVEQFIEFKKIIGALVNISKPGFEFAGLDEQIFTEGCWCGFSYPAKLPPQLFGGIKNDCLKLGKFCHNSGLRGELNIDFVIAEVNGKLCHMLLETNFRHNGFGLILKYAANYFGTYKKCVSYIENFRIPAGVNTFIELKKAMNKFLIAAPGQDQGVIIAAPPFENKCSLIFAAGSQKEIAELIQNVTEELNCAKN